MEHESIELLAEIKSILDFIAFFIVMGCIFWSIKSILSVVANFKTVYKNKWENDAVRFIQTNQLEELKSHCLEKLESSPKDANANWYLARYYYIVKDLDQCKKYFSLAVEVYPTWEEDAETYIKKLERN
ncbi:MAG: hypothetical protein COB51_06650 [Moraxellaceae bacterium]|nr:MAG: hypothetical protein COB51_06650 [Moraxellaceae bacterium]